MSSWSRSDAKPDFSDPGNWLRVFCGLKELAAFFVEIADFASYLTPSFTPVTPVLAMINNTILTIPGDIYRESSERLVIAHLCARHK